MSVKICGRSVRLYKPIKYYALIKTVCMTAAVFTLLAADAWSAEKNSSVSATQCAGLCASLNASAVPQTAPIPDQRTAGSSSHVLSPAVALALAFGVHDVSGPMVRTARNNSKPDQQLVMEK